MLPVDAFITFIYVEDLSRSTVFYEEILQLLWRLIRVVAEFIESYREMRMSAFVSVANDL